MLDPDNQFHASCIAFYDERGYLSPKQVLALKSYVFSVDDIKRILGKPAESVEPIKEPNIIVESDVVKRRPPLPVTVAPKPKKKLSKKEQKKLNQLQKELDEIPF